MNLHDQDYQLKFKSGLEENINTDVTKNLAVEGEPHYATDTNQLHIFDGSENLRIPTCDTNGDIKFSDSDKVFFGTDDDMSIYYDGTDGYIRTDLEEASDLKVDCGTDKTLELQKGVWKDMQFNIVNGKIAAANFPDWDSTFTTNTGAYKFDVNDYIDIGTNELQHDWKEETDIYPHIHVALDGENASGGSYYAKFTIYIAFAKKDTVYTETSKDIEIEIPDGTADLTHLLGSGTAVSTTGLTIGTQLNLRVKRIAATTGTEYPNHIFITQAGIHYESDTIGSRQIATK